MILAFAPTRSVGRIRLRGRVRVPHESMVWSANSTPSSTHTLTLLELDGGLARQGHDRCRWVQTSWRLFSSQLHGAFGTLHHCMASCAAFDDSQRWCAAAGVHVNEFSRLA